jgi:cell division protein FtsB
MKRPIKILDESKKDTIIKNRLSAKRSADRKKQELEQLKKENYFLKIQNKLLVDKMIEMKRSHSHPAPSDIVQLS